MKNKLPILMLLSVTNMAAADAPTVKLGGRLDFMYGAIRQSLRGPNILDRGAVTDGKISLHVDGKASDSLQYGLAVYINADPSTSTTGRSGIIDKNVLYLQSDKFGRIEGGNYPGAAASLGWVTYGNTKAAYGVYGYWSTWINNRAFLPHLLNALPIPQGMTADMAGHSYLLYPSLPSSYSGKYYSDAPKITYYTKPIPSLTIGISYIPDLDSTGTISTAAGPQTGPVDRDRAATGTRSTFKNIINFAAQYVLDLADDMKLKAVVSGEVGQAKKYLGLDLMNGLKAAEFGASFSYGPYSISGAYGNWGKTGSYKNKIPGTKRGASYYTLVSAYQGPKFGLSLSYMNSKRAGGLEPIGAAVVTQLQKNPQTAMFASALAQPYSSRAYNTLQTVSLGAQYKIAEGLLAYYEISRFIFKDKNFNKSNNGYLGLGGIRLNF